MQNHLREFKESFGSFISCHHEFLRDLSISVFGAVCRLAADHKHLQRLSIQFFYDFFRTVCMAYIVVLIVNAIIDSWGAGQGIKVAIAAGSALYAEEIIAAGKGVIKPIVEAVAKRKMK